MGKVYGYIRVSSTDQNEDRQRIALSEVGVEEKNIFWISCLVRISTGHSIRSWFVR